MPGVATGRLTGPRRFPAEPEHLLSHEVRRQLALSIVDVRRHLPGCEASSPGDRN